MSMQDAPKRPKRLPREFLTYGEGKRVSPLLFPYVDALESYCSYLESQAPSLREAVEAALREELALANAECDRLRPLRKALEMAQSDILNMLDNLQAANKTIIADWAHGPFKELDILVGSSCYVLRCTAKEIDAALLRTQPVPTPAEDVKP